MGGPAIDFTSDVTQIQLAPGHVELIRRVLVESGMDTPDLGQLIAFQIDLENDGVDEVLLSSNSGALTSIDRGLATTLSGSFEGSTRERSTTCCSTSI